LYAEFIDYMKWLDATSDTRLDMLLFGLCLFVTAFAYMLISADRSEV